MTMESDVHAWIEQRLSVELDEFNGMPACPYARQAVLDGKVKCVELKNIFGHIVMPDYFRAELENFTYHWPKNIDVVVLGCDAELISSEQLSEIAEQANTGLIGKRGYLVLEDHPSEVEAVAGYTVNQGTWALLLLQSRKKILAAREILERKGYYKNWDEQYYKDVVLDRS